MNYINNELNVLDIPIYEPEVVFYGPYECGMHDLWFNEGDQSQYYYGEALELYKAGKRNAEMILKTLRNYS